MVIWYFIDRTQIVKHENAHNFKKLSTLQTSYLDFLSDPIVRKGATKIRKSVEKNRSKRGVMLFSEWSSEGKENTCNIPNILCPKAGRLV